MITQEYALSHKDEYAVLSTNVTRNTLITVSVLEEPSNFPASLDLTNCLTIGQVLDYSRVIVDCASLTPLTTSIINTYKHQKTYYEEDTSKTIEYITLPNTQDQVGGTYQIADPTWRSSPAHDIKQADIIHWHKMQNLTLTADDIGEKIAPLNDNQLIPIEYLPSYVDDVIEGYYNDQDGNFYQNQNYSNLINGERSKIYIDLNSNKSYRFASDAYVLISGGIDSNLITLDTLTEAISDFVTGEDVANLIEQAISQTFTVRSISSETITVSANDDYAFNIRTAIPSIEGYVPLSIAGYKLSAGEVSLNKLCLNEGYVEAAGTILLNGESSFDITFDIYYVLETKFIPQAEEVGY